MVVQIIDSTYSPSKSSTTVDFMTESDSESACKEKWK
jgi:hypothetical protein